MTQIMVAGAGRIGTLITCLLQESGDYTVHLIDQHFVGSEAKRLQQQFSDFTYSELDVSNEAALAEYAKQHHIQGVISSLPFFCNIHVARVARDLGLHYFDLTEDVSTTASVKEIAEGASSAFVPQCGLAPGFIGIAANSLMRDFDSLSLVKMRVGALPQHASNALHYTLTWSTDGVINEYGNPCLAIEDGEAVWLRPLEGLETIQLDGVCYEAFNTSGGLGSLPELYAGQANNMNYKTMRYPGHCAKMQFLMNDLRLNHDRDTLKRIFEQAVPKTYQDVVLVYVSVTGHQHGDLMEENYVNKVYPQRISGMTWSAIQVSTAAGICAVMDMVLANEEDYCGFVYQEQFELSAFLANRFGRLYLSAE